MEPDSEAVSSRDQGQRPARVSVFGVEEDFDPLILEDERLRLTRVKRPTWFELERQGRAPKRIKISPMRNAWRLSEIVRWREDPAGYRE